ncbi:MAG: hypothetical protein ACRC1T_05510 [Clostridium chrysemydis]|uniref:hypothetical protein n=1 Tax=Clostridium chrysemydis TaxID=2665504 RepID=UPI003F2C2344
MCKYCEGDKWIYEDNSLSIGVSKGKDLLEVHTDTDDYYEIIKVNYCPMCGKKLKS